MEILAARIRQLRDGYGLSLERFARKVDVSTKSVATWERDVGDPELKSLVRLAQACNVSTDYLLGLTDDPKPASGARSAASSPRTREGSAEVASARDKKRVSGSPPSQRVRRPRSA